MPIVRAFEISSSHVQEGDMKGLIRYLQTPDSPCPFILDPRGPVDEPYGVFLKLPDPADLMEHIRAARRQGFSLAFCNVVEAAAARGCAFLILDGDADVDPSLPTHSW